MILEKSFLGLSNIDIQFNIEGFIWWSYIRAEILLIAKRVELIHKRKFTKVALDKNYKKVVVYVVVLKVWELAILIYYSCELILATL